MILDYLLCLVIPFFIFEGNSFSNKATDIQISKKVVKQTEYKNDCDFSAYKPMRINHFPDGSVVLKAIPEYPKNAKRKKIWGNVSVKVLINEDGLVEKACMTNGNQIFKSVSEQTALKWKFKKGMIRPSSSQKSKKGYAQTYINFVFNPDFAN